MKISRNSAKICRIPEIHFANLVDLEKSEKMSIWTQKSASIQPITSCVKFGCGPPSSDGPLRKHVQFLPTSGTAVRGCVYVYRRSPFVAPSLSRERGSRAERAPERPGDATRRKGRLAGPPLPVCLVSAKAPKRSGAGLVERFDIEPFSDFTTN